MRMEKEVLVVCGTVASLGLLSAVLGFAAEATRIKTSDVVSRHPGACIFPKSPALYLGLASAVVLVVAQTIINFVAGCICCKRNPNRSGTNWNIALISFSISWVTFVVAFLVLLTSAALSDQKGRQKIYFGSNCYVLKPGVFSVGAVLSLASVSLGIIYFAALRAPKRSQPSDPTQAWGNALVQHIPMQSAVPVFVHEDTYNRQRIP